MYRGIDPYSDVEPSENIMRINRLKGNLIGSAIMHGSAAVFYFNKNFLGAVALVAGVVGGGWVNEYIVNRAMDPETYSHSMPEINDTRVQVNPPASNSSR